MLIFYHILDLTDFLHFLLLEMAVGTDFTPFGQFFSEQMNLTPPNLKNQFLVKIAMSTYVPLLLEHVQI